ncbi:MAG TPA: hypothetical protein VGC82_02490 [Rhodopila sp.]|jgi:hypothetical protein
MSQSSKPSKGTMRAVLHETEPGLYRAEYSGELNPEDSDARDFPDSHIGTDADGVRQWVETMATNLGYDKVVWDSLDQA